MNVNVKFIRNGAPHGYAYVAGDTTELSKEKAGELMRLGVIEIMPERKQTMERERETKITRDAK